MTRIVFVGLVALFGAGVRADSVAIPLADPDDPIRIVNAAIDFTDTARPAMVLELENRTAFPVSTRDVWLSTARFFTKGENLRSGNRKVWDCGLGASAAFEEKAQMIAPGGSATSRLTLSQCEHNREHEHYFVTVERLAHKFSEPSWKRDPQQFARLLTAAMPHE
jgi:hypothetical protein